MITKYSKDARGLHCPQALLKTRHGFSQISVQINVKECLKVQLTDKASTEAFPQMAALSGRALLLCEQHHDSYRYVLQKSGVGQ
ncbi:MAG: sulfurtransferase TusA family protein [Pseudomonadota bacterium]